MNYRSSRPPAHATILELHAYGGKHAFSQPSGLSRRVMKKLRQWPTVSGRPGRHCCADGRTFWKESQGQLKSGSCFKLEGLCRIDGLSWKG
ncbi:hypothetical protein BST61_g11107 [Cercospora zeina]